MFIQIFCLATTARWTSDSTVVTLQPLRGGILLANQGSQIHWTYIGQHGLIFTGKCESGNTLGWADGTALRSTDLSSGPPVGAHTDLPQHWEKQHAYTDRDDDRSLGDTGMG